MNAAHQSARLILLLVSLLYLVPLVQANEPDEWLPTGFEAFDRPQRTLVDIYHGGYFLTSVWATYTPAEITLESVGKIADSIPGLLRPETFRTSLARTQPTHSGLVCTQKSDTGCGVLSVEDVGLIFDVQRLRVDLFVAAVFLETQGADQPVYLPRSAAGFSVVDDVSLFFSGASAGDTRYNFDNNLVMAYGENRFELRANFTDGNRLSTENLFLQREFRGRSWQAGIFRAPADSFLFMKDSPAGGISLSSSLRTRHDLRQSLGTNIVVFLDSRSRVEVFRNDRLLSASYYDVGNQQLDLTGLPDGAYDILIRITGSSGAVREETRFFSRNSHLPLADQPAYFFHMGEVLEDSALSGALPDGSDRYFVRLGSSRRLNERLGLHLGGAYQTGSLMAEAGLHYLGSAAEMRLSLAVDDRWSLGLDAQFRYSFPAGYLQVSLRHIDANISNDLDGPGVTSLDRNTTQFQMSSSLRTPWGLVSPFYRFSRREADETENYGLRWSLPPMFNSNSLTTSLELSRNDGEGTVLFAVNYRLGSDNWQYASSARYRRESGVGADSNGLEGGVSALWRNGQSGGNQYQWDLRADGGADARVSSRFNAKGNLGEADLTLGYAADREVLSYNGAVRTLFAASSKRAGFGGSRRHSAGYIVTLNGFESDTEQVDIVVDGVKRVSMPPNTTRFVPVSEFGVHEFDVMVPGTNLYSLDFGASVHTFYPGNVIPVAVNASRLVVIMGRLLDESGQPVARGLIEDTVGLATTDSDGFFQAEVRSTSQQLAVTYAGHRCEADVASLDGSAPVAYLGDLNCRTLP